MFLIISSNIAVYFTHAGTHDGLLTHDTKHKTSSGQIRRPLIKTWFKRDTTSTLNYFNHR